MPFKLPSRHSPAPASRLALRGAVPNRGWLLAWLLVWSIALAPLLGQPVSMVEHGVLHGLAVWAQTQQGPVAGH